MLQAGTETAGGSGCRRLERNVGRAILASLILIQAQTAHASSITVNTTVDELVTNGNCSLREAIMAANTDSAVDSCAPGSGDDTVFLPSGTYSISIAGGNEDGSASGDLDVTADVTIAGEGASASIIDGGGLDRVFDIDPAATGARVAISGVTIQNGLAAPSGLGSRGGGILNRGTLSVDRSMIRSNTGSTLDVAGAGIYNIGALTLTDSTVAGNGRTSQGVSGGGLGNADGATMTIRRSTLVGNSTGSFGGGIDSRGVLTIENSTISGNLGFYGGGISNNIGGRTTVINCTITANRAAFGGGILNNSQVSVKNSIVALNTAAGSGGDCLGGITSAGHNLDSDGTCGLAVPGDVSGTDPHLGPLADNGGLTATHALTATSPAVDAGNPTGCSDQNGVPLTSDQRGVARPLDGNGDGAALCDIGAFELAPPNAPPVGEAGDDQVVECAGPGGSMVTLDGSGSYDPDSTPGTNDDIVTYEWFEDYGLSTQTALGSGAVLQAFVPLGSHHISLRVTDRSGLSDTDDVQVAVIDTLPPALSVVVSPNVLWPPNHRMVDVAAEVNVVDACGGAAVLLQSVVNSEPDDSPGGGDGHTTNDVEGADIGTLDLAFRIRAERDGDASGRSYVVTYVAMDGVGHATTATASVLVPHDQRQGTEPVTISVEGSEAGTRIVWTEVQDAIRYDIIRGDVRNLRYAEMSIDLGTVTCVLAGALTPTTAGHEDRDIPALGESFFYLASYEDDRGRSGYGTAELGNPRVVASGGCR
jgi:CSLREA domain-containing protein